MSPRRQARNSLSDSQRQHLTDNFQHFSCDFYFRLFNVEIDTGSQALITVPSPKSYTESLFPYIQYRVGDSLRWLTVLATKRELITPATRLQAIGYHDYTGCTTNSHFRLRCRKPHQRVRSASLGRTCTWPFMPQPACVLLVMCVSSPICDQCVFRMHASTRQPYLHLAIFIS